MSKPHGPIALGCCAGTSLGPALLYGLFVAVKTIDGQVLDRGKYPSSTVVLQWADAHHNDHTDGYKQFYGGHIYTVKRSNGLDVYCEIHIGSPDYNHDCGHLGRVEDLKTARTLWGRMEWTPDAMIVGDLSDRGISVSRAEFQAHR